MQRDSQTFEMSAFFLRAASLDCKTDDDDDDDDDDNNNNNNHHRHNGIKTPCFLRVSLD